MGQYRFDEYQREGARTVPPEGIPLHIITLGLAGEAGEIADLVKKILGHQHEPDFGKLAEELGDLLWYCARLADFLEFDLGAVAAANIEKLKRRYPDGFDPERSKNRDPATEALFSKDSER